MGPLVRLKIRPVGVWTTPWQADSLLGAVACAWARSCGKDALRRDLLDPWIAGEPPFVTSDAFPGNSLPAPAILPVWWDWPPQRRKTVKQQRWLTADDFVRVQHGEMPRLDPPSVAIHHRVHLRNAVSRVTGGAGAGGELFEVPYSHLGDSDESDAHLTVFARTRDDGATILLLEALNLLGRTGYGADASVGHGAFDVDPLPQPCTEFDDVPGASGFVALSTFQPAAHDPVHGCWRAFVKYGTLAPELHACAVFKRPQVMLEPGACFCTVDAPEEFYGTAIGPDRLLDQQARSALATINVHPVQAAFTLAVPIKWQNSP